MGIESLIFRSPKPKDDSSPENNKKPEKVIFPHGEYGIKAYEKEYGNNGEEIKKVREIFDTFVNQEIENIQIYHSEKFGVSFPYTYISAGSFAKELYEKNTGKKAEIKNLEDKSDTEDNQKHINREFVFLGAPLKAELTDNGPFHFAGEAMHQCIKELPIALKKIQNGESQDDVEIFTLGTPINELGTMSPLFLERFKKDSTSVMSEVFAEFIEKNGMKKNTENDKLNIELFGMSWGGSLAAITGEKLLETNAFTQDSEQAKKEGLPKIAIRVQVPISLSRSKIKGLKIWTGSPRNDSVSGDTYGPTMGKENPEFIEQVNTILKERGMTANISEEQQKMKKKAMLDIILDFRKGVKLKPETKITEVYGLNDLTTKTTSLTREVKEQMESHSGSLGQNLAKPQRENSRVFGVDMFHEVPWFRKNELKRIHKVVMDLGKLKEIKST